MLKRVYSPPVAIVDFIEIVAGNIICVSYDSNDGTEFITEDDDYLI